MNGTSAPTGWSEIVFTSGATESDNLAVKGVAAFYRDKGQHIVTVATEHRAVLDPCRVLDKGGQARVTVLKPEPTGLVSAGQVAEAIGPDTVLVSVMHANNEIGVIQPIGEIAELCRSRGVLFHSDAAQSFGKLPLDVSVGGPDLVSVSGHKIYGPKGIGALYVRGRNPRVRLEQQMDGGGHERGMRSGTLPTHQIVGMGEAFALARDESEADGEHVRALRQRFLDGLTDCGGIHNHSPLEQSVPNIVNLAFDGVDGESLLMALRGLAVSTGSACNSASVEPSYVLKGIGVPHLQALASIRFSFGRFTTIKEIDAAVADIRRALGGLRQPSTAAMNHR